MRESKLFVSFPFFQSFSLRPANTMSDALVPDEWIVQLKTISMANLNSSYSFVAFEREMVRFCHSRYRTEVLADEDGANEEGDERDYVVPLNDGPKSRKRGRADEVSWCIILG
jgi:hypothetical protein